MSGIPSDLAASAVQAGYQQLDASRLRDADGAGQAHVVRRQSQAVAESADTVETTDQDVQIYADGGGTGGQGRQLQEEGRGESNETNAEAEGARQPADGGTGGVLDVQA